MARNLTTYPAIRPAGLPRGAPINCQAMISRLVVLSLLTIPAFAQSAPNFTPPPATNEGYEKPFPPFHIIANLYYVGTWDLGCYLIVTPQGNILINTGIGTSVPMIRSNIETLGFKVSDIKLLLATHGHWDHVGGMADFKKLTGAKMLMEQEDVPMLESGGNIDFRFPEGRGLRYLPVKVDQPLKNGDKITLGGMELTAHHHPGHTKGSTSFTFDVQENGKTYRVGIMNMGAINEGVALLKSPLYPNIVEDYARTFHDQKETKIDIFLSSHAGQFKLHQKYKPGDPYNPERFLDPQGFRAEVDRLEKVYLAQLDQERKAK
jgi:metallo-beta-lactamase class B